MEGDAVAQIRYGTDLDELGIGKTTLQRHSGRQQNGSAADLLHGMRRLSPSPPFPFLSHPLPPFTPLLPTHPIPSKAHLPPPQRTLTGVFSKEFEVFNSIARPRWALVGRGEPSGRLKKIAPHPKRAES